MADKKAAVSYKTEELLSSGRFRKYQKDFARTLLKEPEYTISKAENILNNFFGKKKEEN